MKNTNFYDIKKPFLHINDTKIVLIYIEFLNFS